jgi:hypothetical protein
MAFSYLGDSIQAVELFDPFPKGDDHLFGFCFIVWRNAPEERDFHRESFRLVSPPKGQRVVCLHYDQPLVRILQWE